MSSIEFLAQNYEQVSELIAGAIVRRVKPWMTSSAKARPRRHTELGG